MAEISLCFFFFEDGSFSFLICVFTWSCSWEKKAWDERRALSFPSSWNRKTTCLFCGYIGTALKTEEKKGGRLEPCNYLTSAKGGAVSLFMSLTVLIGHPQLLTIWTYTGYFSWKYASVDKTPEPVTAKVQNQICVTSAEMSRLFSCFDFFNTSTYLTGSQWQHWIPHDVGKRKKKKKKNSPSVSWLCLHSWASSGFPWLRPSMAFCSCHF